MSNYKSYLTAVLLVNGLLKDSLVFNENTVHTQEKLVRIKPHVLYEVRFWYEAAAIAPPRRQVRYFHKTKKA